jgi:hypothetical protein
LSVWQLAHVAAGLRRPLCGSWQFAQAEWPFGAVAASALWQPAQASICIFGECDPPA